VLLGRGVGRQRRLRFLEPLFERALLGRRIDEPERGDDVLRLDASLRATT
jgi:hypothetical protein